MAKQQARAHRSRETGAASANKASSSVGAASNADRQDALRAKVAAAGVRSAGGGLSAEATALLANKRLSYDQIAIVRAAIAELPEAERAPYYKKLAAKSTYRNQRDNKGRYEEADSMCNVTAIAMALNALGAGAGEKNKQFEDKIDEMLVKEGEGTRFDQTGQTWIANQFDVEVKRVAFGGRRSAKDTQDWYVENVLPRLEKGQSATMGMAWGPGLKYKHIVRVQWVSERGLRVDDPYGTLYDKGSYYSYDANDTSSAKGQGAKGEDDLWSWETVAAVMASGDRYVQFYSV